VDNKQGYLKTQVTQTIRQYTKIDRTICNST